VFVRVQVVNISDIPLPNGPTPLSAISPFAPPSPSYEPSPSSSIQPASTSQDPSLRTPSITKDDDDDDRMSLSSLSDGEDKIEVMDYPITPAGPSSTFSGVNDFDANRVISGFGYMDKKFLGFDEPPRFTNTPLVLTPQASSHTVHRHLSIPSTSSTTSVPPTRAPPITERPRPFSKIPKARLPISTSRAPVLGDTHSSLPPLLSSKTIHTPVFGPPRIICTIPLSRLLSFKRPLLSVTPPLLSPSLHPFYTIPKLPPKPSKPTRTTPSSIPPLLSLNTIHTPQIPRIICTIPLSRLPSFKRNLLSEIPPSLLPSLPSSYTIPKLPQYRPKPISIPSDSSPCFHIRNSYSPSLSSLVSTESTVTNGSTKTDNKRKRSETKDQHVKRVRVDIEDANAGKKTMSNSNELINSELITLMFLFMNNILVFFIDPLQFSSANLQQQLTNRQWKVKV